jgi:hypothetical protein
MGNGDEGENLAFTHPNTRSTSRRGVEKEGGVEEG